jgi:hypothetical protein
MNIFISKKKRKNIEDQKTYIKYLNKTLIEIDPTDLEIKYCNDLATKILDFSYKLSKDRLISDKEFASIDKIILRLKNSKKELRNEKLGRIF